ncbi:MAG: hypothetical protein ABI183_22000 [Polyangiaceae bacterium]
MRRLVFSALLFAPTMACAAAACGNSSFSSKDNDSGNDASSSEATASGDGSIAADGSAGDASACTGTWCACHASTAAFCDDFDRSGEMIADGWSLDGGFFSPSDSGLLQLSDAQAESAPRSLDGRIGPHGATFVSTGLTEDVGGLSVVIAFDLLVASAGGNCSGIGPVDFAQINAGTTVNDSAQFTIHFAVENGVPALLLAAESTVHLVADSGLPSKWVRVRIATQKIPSTDGGEDDYSASLFLGSAGGDDTADAAALVSGNILSGRTLPVSWASFGVLNDGVANPCEAYIDNVAIYE